MQLNIKYKSKGLLNNWAFSLNRRFECIYEVSDGRYGLENAVDAKKAELMKPNIDNT